MASGTLHSNSAAKTVDRIIDVFPTGDKEMVRAMLASSLQGVIAQTLLKKANGGRIGAFEVLVGTNAVRNLIRENQVAQLYSMIQTGSRYGMITMENAVQNLLEQGVVDKEEARRVLLKSADDGSGDDGEGNENASAALGGGKKVSGKEAKLAAVVSGGGKGEQGDQAEEGYSF